MGFAFERCDRTGKKESRGTFVKIVVPDYYKDFRCIAANCKHNCCIGWEIDVDEIALAKYRCVSGAFGERLRAGIVEEGESACFRLDAQERCPFLNARNLCDIILTFGEDALCDICAEHPRFRNFFSDREELGIGLCCEAACRLILGREEKVSFLTDGTSEENECPSEEECVFYAMREKAFALVQDRGMSISARVENILDFFAAPMPNRTIAEWARIFLDLERLDSGWSDPIVPQNTGLTPGEHRNSRRLQGSPMFCP